MVVLRQIKLRRNQEIYRIPPSFSPSLLPSLPVCHLTPGTGQLEQLNKDSRHVLGSSEEGAEQQHSFPASPLPLTHTPPFF